MKPVFLTLTVPLLLGAVALVFGLLGLTQPDLAGMAIWWLMALLFSFLALFTLAMVAEELPEPRPAREEEPAPPSLPPPVPQFDPKDLRISELEEENDRLRAESGYR